MILEILDLSFALFLGALTVLLRKVVRIVSAVVRIASLRA
jgi:hypothetical protein